ncbi:MAG: hypothetical protein U0521_06515 [Anaerolineae bacterium]
MIRRASGNCWRDAGEGAHAVSDALLLDQPADHADQRRVFRQSRSRIAASRRPPRDPLFQRQPVIYGRDFADGCAFDLDAEMGDGVRDGDPGAGEAPQQVVERAHRLAAAEGVVVVTAGDDRAHARALGGDCAVQVGVDQVGVDDGGAQVAQRGAQPPDHA